MTSIFDVAILGAGTMGAAAACFLSQAGLKVVAFEQFQIAHEMGSHSGSTRIIRHAYHESPDYVPLVLRADLLWQDLETATGSQLLVRTGGFDLGPEEGKVVENAIVACKTHSLPYEHLDPNQIMQRWPQFNVPQNWHACYDPNMGFLLVNQCIRSYVELARRNGAQVHDGEAVLEFKTNAGTIRIKTTNGDYEAAKFVICGGAWSSRILAHLRLPLTVKRKTLAWLQVEQPENFSPGKFPIFLADLPQGLFYGFPIHGHPGIKIANHNSLGEPADPDCVDRNFYPEDARDVQEFASRYLNGVTSKLLDGKVCLYTLTPDEDFIIDLHPEYPNVALAAGFSGHGFKFAPVVGEILSQLILNGARNPLAERFRITRFL
jgi:monomeric sarcosine oxidase